MKASVLQFPHFLLASFLSLAAAPALGDTYVCAGDSIGVFADDAGLGSQPIRTITGPTAGVAECYAIALDNLHGELWVTTQSTVRVFPARANGDVAPLRTITGPTLFATGIAVDVEADEVYVGTPDGSIFVFARTGNGSPAPLRAIQGSQTTLGTVVGIFIDRVYNELYAVNYGGSVVVFDRTANGDVAPSRPFTNSTNPFGLVVDARANEVFLATGTGYVRAFDRSGAALRTIDGTSSGLTQTAGLALRRDGILLVGNQYRSTTVNDAVFGYPRTQNGNASPIIDINFAAPLQRVSWGVATSQAYACGEGQTTSYCLFRSGFE
ncbi:MAG: hypothetical protein JSR27_00685 [Proteobacteria bacterium]|nr:hypothetical protein [Pseudomonadota bacterium]